MRSSVGSVQNPIDDRVIGFSGSFADILNSTYRAGVADAEPTRAQLLLSLENVANHGKAKSGGRFQESYPRDI